MKNLTRRTALRVLAACASVPITAMAMRSVRQHIEPVSWQGQALGGLAGLTLWSTDPNRAKRTLIQVQAEVARLERVFSLHRTDSEIAQLNQVGQIHHPSPDLRFVLEEALRVAEVSKGSFDPTVQALWRLYVSGVRPTTQQLEDALKAVDYAAISLNRRQIRLDRKNMAITLNGIAQGHITDRVTELLGNAGFENAVIQLGETRALGASPDGDPFPISIVDPDSPDRLVGSLALANAALSVSGGYGHQFDASGMHHIFDPTTGRSAESLKQVIVTARTAISADVLSTAIYVCGEEHAQSVLLADAGAHAVLTRKDGSTVAY